MLLIYVSKFIKLHLIKKKYIEIAIYAVYIAAEKEQNKKSPYHYVTIHCMPECSLVSFCLYARI